VIDKLAHFIDTELVAKELEAITHRLKAMIASQKVNLLNSISTH
jgi:hypothetical protein